MYIVNCTNVTLQAIYLVAVGLGTGLVMLDNDGLVLINASRFGHNSLHKAKDNTVLSQGKLLQSVTGQMSNHICSVSAHFFPGLTKLAGRNDLPLIEMIECLAN